jgi:hypothetical protein
MTVTDSVGTIAVLIYHYCMLKLKCAQEDVSVGADHQAGVL